MNIASFDSPLGWLTLTEEDGYITSLDWGGIRQCRAASPLLQVAGEQLEAYFARRLTRFDLPMSVPSTPFQHGVYEALHSIGYGHTKTYGDIAGYVEGSAQAVGRACGVNRIPIIIPCHRVLGVSTLGGFSGKGGVDTKVFLLRLEGAAGLLI
ncbi:MAG: methylated-DNA--[protein]-cysteine S-methyltransferase [Rhodobacterales bacterium]|nr:methylated-DNA--[protein]-cysteine S-methyltransferase [Pseudomonadota bacterium]